MMKKLLNAPYTGMNEAKTFNWIFVEKWPNFESMVSAYRHIATPTTGGLLATFKAMFGVPAGGKGT